MDVVLRTNSSDPALAFRQVRSVGTAYECVLQIRSDGFMSERSFWFEQPDLQAFVQGLRRMDCELTGEVELRTRYEDNFVRLQVSQRGTVTVSGVLTAYGALNQELRFAFRTDQTVLGPLINDFDALLGASMSGGSADAN
jgi:hypothetical protein